MKKNYEYEAKCLIEESDYETILKSLSLSNTHIQTNHYLETENNDLKNNNLALRIRLKNKKFELTLKQKIKTGNIENNIDIDFELANYILSTKKIPEELCAVLGLDFNFFDSISTIVTTRTTFDFENIIVELDKSTFNEKTDFEIEIEADNIEIANHKMELLLNKFDINFKKSMPKIARFHLYNQ